MKFKILITDELHPLLKEGLEQGGFEVDYRPDISTQEVKAVVAAYTGLIINSRINADRQLLEHAIHLKFVARAGSGLEVIDQEYAKQKNVAIINSPEGNRNAVAEHALGMLLNLMNNISVANAEVKGGLWLREKNRGFELSGKTVGLIAYGNTAQAFSKLLSFFDVKVLAYDKYTTGFSSSYVTESSLTSIFANTDVLSIHLPLTTETRGMVDYTFLTSFKKPYWLLNTSRGTVLQTEALLKCMDEGKIKGAALDVLENEKPDTYNIDEKAIFARLAANDKIILTPHIAGWTYESKRKIAEVLLSKIRALGLQQ